MRLRNTRGLKRWATIEWEFGYRTHFLRDVKDNHIAQIDERDASGFSQKYIAGGTSRYHYYESLEKAKRTIELEVFEKGYFFLTEAQLNLL